MTDTEYIFIDDLADEFAAVTPGKPFRLFKFGTLYKGGNKRSIAKDNPFRLPHFKPPIKLGSHREETPAGGFLTDIEVREDGIWGVPEYTEEGIKALEKGSYRYHSPEVIWEGGYIEDPDTGNKIQGPLIVGVALTHTPHLGETTALYTYQQEQPIMSEQLKTVEVPVSLWDKFMAMFDKQEVETPEPQPEPEGDREEFEAAIQERDEYKAELERMKAEQAQADLFDAIRGEFNTDEYGAAFRAIPDEDGAVEMLATMDEETRKWVIGKLSALSAQKDITDELGDDKPLEEGPNALQEAAQAYADEHGVTFGEAVKKVAQERPELYQAYKGGK